VSRSRRVVAMVTGSAAILGFGFVVAVAAKSLPGDQQTEPLLDVVFRSDLDPTPILAWILIFLAIAGGVLYAMGLKEAKPRKEAGKRGILAVLIGLVLFVALYRWIRPAAEAFLQEAPSAVDPVREVIGDDGGGGAGAWLFSLLLAAVLAATLTRIGLSIKTTVPSFVSKTDGEMPTQLPAPPEGPAVRSLGADPRSRVLAAYEDFESDLATAGQPRGATETTAHHARRVAGSLNLDEEVLHTLVDRHAAARYGRVEPTEADAGLAERSSSILRERIKG